MPDLTPTDPLGDLTAAMVVGDVLRDDRRELRRREGPRLPEWEVARRRTGVVGVHQRQRLRNQITSAPPTTSPWQDVRYAADAGAR